MVKREGVLINLITDFGEGSYYVGAMKGSIYKIHPAAQIVDTTHCISPQSVGEASFVLQEVFGYFPSGTIHVVVVDPGVGSERQILCFDVDGQKVIGPDNGFITAVSKYYTVSSVHLLEPARISTGPISSTFHGRDVMAPAAAMLACGHSIDELAKPAEDFYRLKDATYKRIGSRIVGRVQFVDSFGNIVTNISTDAAGGLAQIERAEINGIEIDSIGSHYAQFAPGALGVICSSGGYLEICCNQGNAAELTSAQRGCEVSIITRSETPD